MPPKTTSGKKAATTTSTTKKAATTYKANQNGIIPNDDPLLVVLIGVMKDFKDATDDKQQAFIDACGKSKASHKCFLQRLWYSLIDAGIEKPSRFTSLKINELFEALFVDRKKVTPEVDTLYQANKARQYVNTHSVGKSNMLTEKPGARRIVNICKKVNDIHAKIGKGVVFADTQNNDSRVEVSITEVDSDYLLIHKDEEFKVGAILSWPWVDLAIHIEAMKRKSAEDGALGISFRPRTLSTSIFSSGVDPSSSTTNGSGVGSANNGSSSFEAIKIAQLEKKIQQQHEQFKKQIENLKRKRQEDALTIQSYKKQCERLNESMQQTKKYIMDFQSNMLSLDIFKVQEGTYIMTFEGIEKAVPHAELDRLLNRKQPNVVIEQLMTIFGLETVTIQQFRGLDLIMTSICPLMKESKYRLKNFKDRKSALLNRQIRDDGATARAKVVLVDGSSKSTVLLRDDEQNTDIARDDNVDNDDINECDQEVLPGGGDDDEFGGDGNGDDSIGMIMNQ